MQVVSRKAREFLEVFSKRIFDSVFAMCYEIHPELVYDQYFSARIDKWYDTIAAKSKEEKQNFNTHFQENITTEFKFVSDEIDNLRCIRTGVKSSKQMDELVSFVRIAFQVASEMHHDLVFQWLDNSVKISRTAEEKFSNRRLGNISILVNVTKVDGKLKINAKNIADKKLSSADMRKLKGFIETEWEKFTDDSRIMVKDYRKNVQVTLSKLRDERSHKVKSIDQILGL